MTGRRPTIADVARQVGVSKGAVSFALNGRPGVAAETRSRILAAAAELGWQPSQRARSLSVSRAFSLGFIVARDPALLGSDPFFPAFIAGLESTLSRQGQVLVLQVVTSPDDEVAGYRRLAAESRVDGFVLSDLRHADPRIALVQELGLPAVTLNRPDIPAPFPALCLHDTPGVTEAVRHLAGLGHTRIAHVAGPDALLHGRRRRVAFLEELDRLGLPPGPVEIADFTAAGGTSATRRLLDRADPPTAIVYANDLMAIAGMTAARQAGLRIPEDLSITGYDDTELAAFVHPALTTVRADPFRWGELAADTLLALIDGRQPAETELPDAQLVLRDSTAPPGRPPTSPAPPHPRPPVKEAQS
ncbi:LacI family DNA-binding transcriptional regulator [Plantactinospora siamensis]|uniref:LacI family DNA-binding transcriptional regulator n=1 Tax=Plantactinospora siamensis TaxID=555372 RepID=A0ABV6NXG6_9ACTN